MFAKRLDSLLENYLNNNQKTIDLLDTFSRFTTDILVTSAFGVDGQAISNPDWEFFKIAKRVNHLTLKERILCQIATTAPWILKVFKISVVNSSIYKRIRESVWTAVNLRQKNNIHKNDFLETLLEVREKTLKQKAQDPAVDVFDGDFLVAQCYIFLVAGFETSSFTISLTLYELALQPNLQEKLREEIRSILLKYNNEITYDCVQEMQYLKQCINETLRKYPILPYLDRMCLKNYHIPNTKHVIEKGTPVFIALMGMHNDPEIYPDPERYNPDRFAEDLKEKMAYLPFGEGPRNCIGMRFALLQVKTALVSFLNKYKTEPCPETPIPLKFDSNSIFLSLRHGLPLKVVPC